MAAVNTPESEKDYQLYSKTVTPSSTPDVKSLHEEEKSIEPSVELAFPPEEAYLEDGPRRGWLVVLGCFMFSAVTVGWGYAWGVLEDYYKTGILSGTSDTVLSLLGSLSGLIMTICSVVTGKLADRYGYKPFLAAGGALWIAGMVGAAFSTKLWHFFLTQAVIQGLSWSLTFPLIVALPAQWFVKRRAFAIGIIVAGSSFGGAVASLVLRAMLSALGLRKTLLIIAGMETVLLVIAMMLIKERRRPGTVPPPIVWVDRQFLSDPVFWSLGFCLLFSVFGYLPPIFFLPMFVKDKIPGISQLKTALPITVLNLSGGIGRATIGFFADRVGPVNSLLFVALMSGLCQLLIWNFVTNYAGILVFSILYGFFCGCLLSLTPAVAARLYGPGRLAGLSGLVVMFNTPGNGAGAPVSGAVLRATGNNWHAVASLNGSLQVAGAICLCYARWKRAPKIIAAY